MYSIGGLWRNTCYLKLNAVLHKSKQVTSLYHTFDAPVPGAQVAERTEPVVERHDNHLTQSRQRLAVIHPEGGRAAKVTAAVYPHLQREMCRTS